MIVEFIGCTGSGKSTLISQVQSRLAETTRVVTAHELVAGRIGLGGVTHPTARNLIEELAGLPFFLRSLPRHRAYLAFTVRLLRRNPRPPVATLNNLRSLERKIGVYEIIRRHRHDAIILVDEGPIQAVHMFAPDVASLSAPKIARFAGLLPLPDLVVYVRSPVDTLVERTLHRPDPPREVRSKPRAATEAHIRRAVALFDRLVQDGNLRGRVLTVENAGHTPQEYDDLVEHVAQSILNCGPAHYRTGMPEPVIPGLSQEPMLNTIRRLVDELNANGLTYCHWKSNLSLPESLAGRTDIDLLVRPDDAASFRAILDRLGFRQADLHGPAPLPAMEHYFALDEESGVLVHVHAYYAVITGESLAKNYRLPVEEMLFRNRREQDGVPVPAKSAELVIFTVRMMLKHTSLIELLLLARDWSKVRQEAAWLTEGGTTRESLRLVREWLPSIGPSLFSRCAAALRGRGTLLRRILLGQQLRHRLRVYARQSAVRSSLDGLRKFSGMVARRLARSRTGMALRSGGAVIAFVGPEATGKSTLLGEVRSWLGEHFVVEQVHAGKPRSTALSALPNLAVPALRSLLPSYRSGSVEVQYSSEDASSSARKTYPLIFGIRSVLLAYDRRALLTRARRRAANGTIVLCDRYPSTAGGSTDGPQLSRFDVSRRRSPVRYLLARAEQRLYDDIPAPDLVILLSVPLEVAIARNKTRGKEEPEDFVRRRHAQSAQAVFEKSPVFEVCTDRPLHQTVSAIKQAIWQAL